jgi:SAM-dependent methyltransferase
LTGASNPGFCSICGEETRFIERGPWLRDEYRCVRCGSIPRARALIHALDREFPNWRMLKVHESSPGGAASTKLQRECSGYLATHFFPDVPLGQVSAGFRCENLEDQTFPDESFDLVVTQDVLEHVMNPALAFSEIARTLRVGGAHVFTVPWYYWKSTLVRATLSAGQVQHLLPPDYHGNPIDARGSLVVREWGLDLLDFIRESSGLQTAVVRVWDRRLGIDGEFREVFVSRK